MNRDTDKSRIVSAYQRLFNSDDGRTVLEDLKSKTSYSRPDILNPFQIDLNNLIYSSAQRAMVLYIEKKINTDLIKGNENE